MIKTLMAHTTEIDDIDLALTEIKNQLAIENGLLSNSVGIVACHYEFLYSGAAKTICDSLPFDVLGAVTLSHAVKEANDSMMLTITVLTSDDVSFKTIFTAPFSSDNHSDIIENAYLEAASERSEKPALIIPFLPFIFDISGDEYIDIFTRISGDVPYFGTLAIDDTENVENAHVVFNGEYAPDRMALLLIYGDINPRFFIATLSPEQIIDKPAFITKSDRNILIGVNNHPVEKFFTDLGLAEASEKMFTMDSMPFLLDYCDGTPPVSRVFLGTTPERHSICAGHLPEGATLSVGFFDKEDVLFTTGNALDKALDASNDASFMLIFSCISRSISLGFDADAELNLVQKKLGSRLPYMASYSGGEICPTQISSSKVINRYHNNTFIICML